MAVREAEARAAALQERILGTPPTLPATADALHREIRKRLIAASNDGSLKDPPHHVFRILKVASDGQPHRFAILGGEKNFKRNPALARFTRDDGAWFGFTLTVEERRGEPVALVAYDFELRTSFGPRLHFVRFDLNPPGHANDDADIRCHIHPDHDDIQVPSPLLHPVELLDLFLHGMRPRDADKLRN